MSNLTSLRTAIENKLNTLTGSGQKLAVVFDYHNLDNDGQFPFVTFEPVELSSDDLDTCNNLRSYTFDIFLYQEITTNGRDESLRILIAAFEDIINAFDSDYTLGGLAKGGINPVSGDFGQLISGDGKMLFANIKLTCKIIKDINI